MGNQPAKQIPLKDQIAEHKREMRNEGENPPSLKNPYWYCFCVGYPQTV